MTATVTVLPRWCGLVLAVDPCQLRVSRMSPTAALREVVKKYGSTGIYTYLALSGCVTCGKLHKQGWRKVAKYLHGDLVWAQELITYLSSSGFYMAIKQKIDVKKYLGITGNQTAVLLVSTVSNYGARLIIFCKQNLSVLIEKKDNFTGKLKFEVWTKLHR